MPICALKPGNACVPTQALGTAVLPLLWAHLARSMGLPLEAPKQAKRGWSIAALQRGAQSLLPQHAALLGLFCRFACSAVCCSLPLVEAAIRHRKTAFSPGQLTADHRVSLSLSPQPVACHGLLQARALTAPSLRL